MGIHARYPKFEPNVALYRSECFFTLAFSECCDVELSTPKVLPLILPSSPLVSDSLLPSQNSSHLHPTSSSSIIMASSGRLVGTIHAAVEDEAVSLSREVPSTTPTRKRKYTGITSRPTTKSRGPDPKAPGITSTSKRTMAPITLPTVVRPSKKMDTVPITQTKDNGEKRIKTEEGAAATEPPKEKQASKATVKYLYCILRLLRS